MVALSVFFLSAVALSVFFCLRLLCLCFPVCGCSVCFFFAGYFGVRVLMLMVMLMVMLSSAADADGDADSDVHGDADCDNWSMPYVLSHWPFEDMAI